MLYIEVIPITLFFFGMVVWSFWYARRAQNVARASLAWPTAAARIVESNLDDGDAGCVLKLRYTYEVDGKHYESARVFTGGIGGVITGTRAYCEAASKRYPDGGLVIAYYDPHKPSYAVLEPGTRSGAIEVYAIGTLMLMLVAAIIFFVILPAMEQ